MIYKDEYDNFVTRAERLSGPWPERVGGLRSHTDGVRQKFEKLWSGCVDFIGDAELPIPWP